MDELVECELVDLAGIESIEAVATPLVGDATCTCHSCPPWRHVLAIQTVLAEHVHVDIRRWYRRQARAAGGDFSWTIRGFVLLHWLLLGGAGAVAGAVVGTLTDAPAGRAAKLGLVTGMVVGFFLAYAVAIKERIDMKRRRGRGRG